MTRFIEHWSINLLAPLLRFFIYIIVMLLSDAGLLVHKLRCTALMEVSKDETVIELGANLQNVALRMMAHW